MLNLGPDWRSFLKGVIFQEAKDIHGDFKAKHNCDHGPDGMACMVWLLRSAPA
jgi:hypothetical protein